MSCWCVNSSDFSRENLHSRCAEALVQFFPRKFERINTPTRHVLLHNHAWLNVARLVIEPAPVSNIACDFHPDKTCGYTPIGLNDKAFWDFLEIEGVNKISDDGGNTPDCKVHGANVGPYGADRTQLSPMLAP